MVRLGCLTLAGLNAVQGLRLLASQVDVQLGLTTATKVSLLGAINYGTSWEDPHGLQSRQSLINLLQEPLQASLRRLYKRQTLSRARAKELYDAFFSNAACHSTIFPIDLLAINGALFAMIARHWAAYSPATLDLSIGIAPSTITASPLSFSRLLVAKMARDIGLIASRYSANIYGAQGLGDSHLFSIFRHGTTTDAEYFSHMSACRGCNLKYLYLLHLSPSHQREAINLARAKATKPDATRKGMLDCIERIIEIRELPGGATVEMQLFPIQRLTRLIAGEAQRWAQSPSQHAAWVALFAAGLVKESRELHESIRYALPTIVVGLLTLVVNVNDVPPAFVALIYSLMNRNTIRLPPRAVTEAFPMRTELEALDRRSSAPLSFWGALPRYVDRWRTALDTAGSYTPPDVPVTLLHAICHWNRTMFKAEAPLAILMRPAFTRPLYLQGTGEEDDVIVIKDLSVLLRLAAAHLQSPSSDRGLFVHSPGRPYVSSSPAHDERETARGGCCGHAIVGLAPFVGNAAMRTSHRKLLEAAARILAVGMATLCGEVLFPIDPLLWRRVYEASYAGTSQERLSQDAPAVPYFSEVLNSTRILFAIPMSILFDHLGA